MAAPTMLEMVIPEAPQNLVDDNAYDSDKLDSELSSYGIELISPHRTIRREFSWDATSRLLHHPVEAFVRYVLERSRLARAILFCMFHQ